MLFYIIPLFAKAGLL